MTATDETLANKLANLDKAIAERKAEAEKATTTTMRDRLERQAEFLNTHERGAIIRHHEAKMQKQAEQAAELESRQQVLADKAIAAAKSNMRAKFVGTDAQFEQAWPGLLAIWQRETALGRMPAEQPTRGDINF